MAFFLCKTIFARSFLKIKFGVANEESPKHFSIKKVVLVRYIAPTDFRVRFSSNSSLYKQGDISKLGITLVSVWPGILLIGYGLTRNILPRPVCRCTVR